MWGTQSQARGQADAPAAGRTGLPEGGCHPKHTLPGNMGKGLLFSKSTAWLRKTRCLVGMGPGV